MTPREKNHAMIDTIARDNGFTLADIIGPRKHKKLSAVRHLCVLMLHEKGHSTTEIGRIINRCHTTISYTLNKKVKP